MNIEKCNVNNLITKFDRRPIKIYSRGPKLNLRRFWGIEKNEDAAVGGTFRPVTDQDRSRFDWKREECPDAGKGSNVLGPSPSLGGPEFPERSFRV